MNFQKGYTRAIGIFFVLVIISLITDYINFGFRPETMHKIFHVVLGSLVIGFGWNNKKFWKPFCIVNGLFFSYVALFGWIFPDFAGLETFNRMDTILHSIVGLSGVIIGFFKK